jgi:hypothetical protein
MSERGTWWAIGAVIVLITLAMAAQAFPGRGRDLGQMLLGLLLLAIVTPIQWMAGWGPLEWVAVVGLILFHWLAYRMWKLEEQVKTISARLAAVENTEHVDPREIEEIRDALHLDDDEEA